MRMDQPVVWIRLNIGPRRQHPRRVGRISCAQYRFGEVPTPLADAGQRAATVAGRHLLVRPQAGEAARGFR